MTAALFKPAIAGTLSMVGIYYVVTRFLDTTAPVLVGMGIVFVSLYSIAILALGGIEEERNYARAEL